MALDLGTVVGRDFSACVFIHAVVSIPEPNWGKCLAEYEPGSGGLPRAIVGEWAQEKHERLTKYVDISRHAGKKYIGPRKPGAGYIDLFSGPGESRIRDTETIIDGSPVAAFKKGQGRWGAFH